MPPTTDQSLYEEIRTRLYSPVLGDILDQLGYHHQFLPQPIQAMRHDMVVIGRAMPVLIADAFGPQPQPFGKLTQALDQLQPGEIYLGTGGSMRCAAWGEIMTATAKARSAAGAIINGFHRDTRKVLEQNWPVFSRGRYAQDAGVRSSVIDYRCRVEIDGVRVEPGDLVFGDLDGVLVIPQACEREVIERALEKAAGEVVVRREIEGGASSTDVFARHGIL